MQNYVWLALAAALASHGLGQVNKLGSVRKGLAWAVVVFGGLALVIGAQPVVQQALRFVQGFAR
jgi:hypothetical protein